MSEEKRLNLKRKAPPKLNRRKLEKPKDNIAYTGPKNIKAVVVQESTADLLSNLMGIISSESSRFNSKVNTGSSLSLKEHKALRMLVQSLIDLSKESREQKKLSLLEGLTDDEIKELVEEALKTLHGENT